MRGRYSDQNQPIVIKKKSSAIGVFELQWCIYVVLCSVYSGGPTGSPGGSCVHWYLQSRNQGWSMAVGPPPTSSLRAKRSISQQMSPSWVWSTEIKATAEEEEREEMKVNAIDSVVVNPPSHLLSRLPTQLSPQSGSRQLSCLLPLILFNTGRQMHHTLRATQDPRPSLRSFQRKRWIWKSSSQGSAKEAISITPMSASHVDKITILWCLSSHRHSESTADSRADEEC